MHVATEVTELTEERYGQSVPAFLCDLCVLCGKEFDFEYLMDLASPFWML
jgi:hypothetical protein